VVFELLLLLLLLLSLLLLLLLLQEAQHQYNYLLEHLSCPRTQTAQVFVAAVVVDLVAVVVDLVAVVVDLVGAVAAWLLMLLWRFVCCFANAYAGAVRLFERKKVCLSFVCCLFVCLLLVIS